MQTESRSVIPSAMAQCGVGHVVLHLQAPALIARVKKSRPYPPEL